MARRAIEDGFELFLPSLNLCTDNAAMIAAAAITISLKAIALI